MRIPECIAKHTKHFFNDKCNQQLLFILSMITLCVFLFINNICVQWSMVAVFLFLCLLKRGKVRIIPSIMIVLSITFFALLQPRGRVIINLGSFRVTQDALFNGLHRSGILIGMVFVSQFAINSRVKLPGKTGAFITQMFTYFDCLTQKHISIKPGSIVQSIDQRLLEIWNEI